MKHDFEHLKDGLVRISINIQITNFYFIYLELALALCYLKQIYLPPSSTTMCREKMLQRLQLIERGEIHIEEPRHLSIYSKNDTIYIFVTTENKRVYALSPTFLYDNSTPILVIKNVPHSDKARIPPGNLHFNLTVLLLKKN